VLAEIMTGMSRELIGTDRSPRSVLYSQGVRVKDDVYVPGMTGIDPATGALAGKSSIRPKDRR
jgi:2-iminobutanoate/2-iminopropanoate deaminase